MNDKLSLSTEIDILKTRVKWGVKRAAYKASIGADISPQLVSNPLLEWPRNFKCVCGSGKKFKRCCLNGLARQVTIEDARKINQKLEKYRA